MALDEVPDLIISDVMMPLMDGFSLCKKLKHDIRTSHIPIILLTARNETAAKMEGLKSGADAYLGKPFNKEELFIRVDKLIALRKELRDSLERLINDPLRNESAPEVSSDLDVTASHEQEYAFLNRVREIVESHLAEDEFGISDLSAELGMSRSQLYRKFTALTDSSVHQFIKNFRLKKARHLLRTTDLNVSEVAYDTGFKNPSHFSRVYRERFGMPPSKEKENVMA
jgi:YesN/AraC family two-component response regulator